MNLKRFSDHIKIKHINKCLNYKKQRHADMKSRMFGLVAEQIHADPAAKRASKGCGEQKGPLTDPPHVLPGFFLVCHHLEKANDGHYYKITGNNCLNHILNLFGGEKHIKTAKADGMSIYHICA